MKSIDEINEAYESPKQKKTVTLYRQTYKDNTGYFHQTLWTSESSRQSVPTVYYKILKTETKTEDYEADNE